MRMDGMLQVILGFNPTLVRLRLNCGTRDPPQLHPFQSHAGSIEARLRKQNLTFPSLVSIPRWFD